MPDDERGRSRAGAGDHSHGDDDAGSDRDGPPTGRDGPAAPTTRQRILERLREGPATPSALGDEFSLPPGVALDHVSHVARSLDDAGGGGERNAERGEELLVRPPTCRDCGFDAFDDRLNRPSRCPECRSERVREPAFVVE